MDRSLPILVLLCSAALPALAQNSTSPGAQAAANSAQQAAAAGDTSKIIFARNPDVDTPNPDAGLEPVGAPLSANLQGELAEGAPRYQPPAAIPASGVGPDLRDTDKPKNEIPRVPVSTMSRYVVKGTREIVFQGRDLYTPEGLVDLSFKAHPGLRVGNFFNLNAGAAYQAFLDEERMGRMDELEDTARAMAAGGDAAEAQAIQDAAARAYMRTEDVEGPVGIK